MRIFCLKFRYSEFIQKHFFKFFWNVQLCLIFMNMSIPPTEKRNDSEPKLTLQNTWCKMKLLILKYGVDFWTCTIMNTQKLDIYHIPWSDTLTKKCNGNWLPTHLETQVKVILPCSSECWSLSIVSLHAVNELPRQHWTKRGRSKD